MLDRPSARWQHRESQLKAAILRGAPVQDIVELVHADADSLATACQWGIAHKHHALVDALLGFFPDPVTKAEELLPQAVFFGMPTMIRVLRRRGARLSRLKAYGHDLLGYPESTQVALLSVGEIRSFNLLRATENGLAPQAICAVLQRKRRFADIGKVLTATGALVGLAPGERAQLLRELGVAPETRAAPPRIKDFQ